MNGWDDVRNRYSESQFYNLVKSLVDIGIPRALLQNLEQQQGQKIPMVELVKFNFDKQAPEGYKPTISKHINDFNMYLKKPKLTLVA